MTNAPERIWLAADDAYDDCPLWEVISEHAASPDLGDNEYIRADLVAQRTPEPAVQALVEALRFGVDLIEGDSFGAEWKRGQSDFRRMARAALATFGATTNQTKGE